MSHDGHWVVLGSEPHDLVGVDVMQMAMRRLGGGNLLNLYSYSLLRTLQSVYTEFEWHTEDN